MSIKALRLVIVLGIIVVATSACSLVTVNNSGGKQSKTGENRSVFLSVTRGASWHPMDAIPNISGHPLSLNGLDVNILRADPEDSSAVYLGTRDHGLYYTYDIKGGWNKVSSLPAKTINDLEVNPSSRCIIYAASGNILYRSLDCTRDWQKMYVDSSPQVQVQTIAIDYNNPYNVYIGTSRGEIIKSIDGGSTWRTIHHLTEGIAKISISPINSNLLFVATKGAQVYSFTSNSQTNRNDPSNVDLNFAINNWTDYTAVLKGFNPGSLFRDIIITPQEGVIFIATNKSILRSLDGGSTWEDVKLIQAAKDTSIKALAVDPQDINNLYYVNDSTFFSSKDGGVSWKTQSLPSARQGQSLLIDAQHPNTIYLGTVKVKK